MANGSLLRRADQPCADRVPFADVPADEQAVDVLSELLEHARDGEHGFRTCAREVPSASSLRQSFNRRASQYHEACDDLERMIRRHGGSPIECGTTGATIHRGWVRVKGAIGANSELSLLDDCERSEEAAVALYREAMQRNLPPDVRDLVERQAASAQQSQDQLRVLRGEIRLGA
ncbi:hypothetical protein GmRootV59_62800 (plasmid) [Variovorax sp. V59]|uniref:ferritin-like domain-containing protein n=1 Tax=unclassified Variovorax TaxID=663243 RepID=UPI0034E84FC9